MILSLIRDLCKHLIRCCVDACADNCQENIAEWLKKNGLVIPASEEQISNSELELQTVIEAEIINQQARSQSNADSVFTSVLPEKEVDDQHMLDEIIPMMPDRQTTINIIDLTRPPPYNPTREYIE